MHRHGLYSSKVHFTPNENLIANKDKGKKLKRSREREKAICFFVQASRDVGKIASSANQSHENVSSSTSSTAVSVILSPLGWSQMYHI